MKKLLLNNNGFMLVELIIVLGILSIIVAINSIFINNNQSILIADSEQTILNNQITSKRQLAINKKIKIELVFNENTLEFKSETFNEIIKFKTIIFNEQVSLHFNKYGIINQAKTINFRQLSQQHRLVFYLGKGWYKIE